MAYISFQDASFTYPNGYTAVDSVSLAIEKGENVAIIGRNGAGKTTAVKMMNGLNKPTSGTVMIGDMDTRDYTAAAVSRVVGYVFQNPDEQIFHSTVISEVGFGPRILKFDEAKKKRLVDRALEITGLSGQRETNPFDLPLSVRKFVTIASVIAMDSEVMIFDEPTAGQDPEGVRRLSRILRELHSEGKTVLTITHDMEFVAENFSRVIVMAEKKIIATGTPREIFWSFDTLDRAMLKQPCISRLCRALGLSGDIIHMDEAVEAIV